MLLFDFEVWDVVVGCLLHEMMAMDLIPKNGMVHTTNTLCCEQKPLKNAMHGDRATFTCTGILHIHALAVMRRCTFPDHLRVAFLRLRLEEKIDRLVK